MRYDAPRFRSVGTRREKIVFFRVDDARPCGIHHTSRGNVFWHVLVSIDAVFNQLSSHRLRILVSSYLDGFFKKKLEKSRNRKVESLPSMIVFFCSKDPLVAQFGRELFSLSLEKSPDYECRNFAEKIAKYQNVKIWLENIDFLSVFIITFRRLLRNVSYFQQKLFSLCCIECTCQIDIRKKVQLTWGGGFADPLFNFNAVLIQKSNASAKSNSIL